MAEIDWTCNRPPPLPDWLPQTVVSSAQGVKPPCDWKSLALSSLATALDVPLDKVTLAWSRRSCCDFAETVSAWHIRQQLRRRKRRRNWI